MGYYTNFDLTIELWAQENAPVLDDVMAVLEGILGYNEFYLEGQSIKNSMKWYDHDEDVAELSKQFPGVTFRLHGEGENSGDLWNAYYKDGLCQICRGRTTYPECTDDWMTVESAQLKDQQENGGY